MPLYICVRCGLKTELKSNYKRHIYRKHTCNPIIRDVPINEVRESFLMGKIEQMSTKCKPNVNQIVNQNKIYSQNDSVSNCIKCELCNKTFNSRQAKYCNTKKCNYQNTKKNNSKF